MFRLPFLEVGDRDLVVRILQRLRGHVHNRGCADQLVGRELVHGLVPFGEVDRRVDVRAAVFGGVVAVRGVEVTLRCEALEFGFQSEALGRGPVNCV